jgi:M-phase inducer tyrosine phosphatase
VTGSNSATPTVVVDTRFDYEFNGGHIAGAHNVYSTEMLEVLLGTFENPPVIVFHCEFS